MTDHLIAPDEMVLSRQARLFELDAVEPADGGRPAPLPPARIHPATVSAWTPALTAQYATQVYRESIEQFEKKAIALRRLAGGDRHSHYWRAADSALAAASALRGVQA